MIAWFVFKDPSMTIEVKKKICEFLKSKWDWSKLGVEFTFLDEN